MAKKVRHSVGFFQSSLAHFTENRTTYGVLLFFLSFAVDIVGRSSVAPALFPPFSNAILSCFEALLQYTLFSWLFALDFSVLTRAGIDYNAVLDVSVSPCRLGHLTASLSFGLAVSLAVFAFAFGLNPAPPLNTEKVVTIAGVTPVAAYLMYSGTAMVTREGRRFLALIWEIFFAPLYGVKFVHIVVADAMTSACLLLWELEYGVCFLSTAGAFLTDSDLTDNVNRCDTSHVHGRVMKPVMTALPFWLRFVQCLVKLYECRSLTGWARWQHAVNAGKYSSALAVVVSSTIHATVLQTWSFWLWIGCLIVKTTYCYVWDLMMDWDFKLSRACFLRPQLIFHGKTWLYKQAIFTNLCGRIAWSFAISPHIELGELKILLAAVEILRRAQWVVFRVENEHFATQRRASLLVNGEL